MGYHVFVAMPFGVKKGFDGKDIDFNAVYTALIKPALEHVGFEVFRADAETRGGDIKTDMFQELLIADLVVADLTIDNPNVWYELGVRHALRARGVVLVQSDRPYQPFDVYTERKLRYRLRGGVPDPTTLEDDRNALARMATDTMNAWHGRPVSPVYQLLAYLEEPEWRNLELGRAKEFWEAHRSWTERITVAKQLGRPGDIMVLAEEGSTRIFRVDAHRRAGAELRAAGQLKFALEQYEQALELEPDDLESRRQKGMLLGKLGRYDAAKEWLKAIVRDHPTDGETFGYIGRLEKDAWTASWRQAGQDLVKMKADASLEDALLRESIRWYADGFRIQPDNYYPGINAVTLIHLLRFVTGEEPAFEEDCAAMEGAVRWAAKAALARAERKNERDYWAAATLGDIELLVGERAAVERAYKDAVAIAEGDWFALNSSREQLALMRDLGYRPEQVGAAIAVFDRALGKIERPREAWKPKRVCLFSGHMIDAKDRAEPRFPADKELIAANAIAAQLDRLGIGPGDIGLCGGACGGDGLFAEAALRRGARLQIRIPFDEPTFLQNSVAFEKSAAHTQDNWRERYYAIKNDPKTTLFVMPDELGPTPPQRNPYQRLNLWQLYSALAYGPEKVHAVLLWNGEGGDGPGGTKHMHDEVNRRTGQVYVLDTRQLW